jgi:hypothetical protein
MRRQIIHSSIVLLTCGCSADSRCGSVDDPDNLWPHAAQVRVDVYGHGAQCDQGTVSGGGTPLSSRTFDPHGGIALDLPSGDYTLTLTLLSDSGTAFATACQQSSSHSSGCLRLSVQSACGSRSCWTNPDGGACQIMHSNGVGQSFYDCVAAGTHNQTQATEACAAFTGDASQCHSMSCGSGSAVCSDGSGDACDCWIYSGDSAGRVKHNSVGSCGCQSDSSTTWY